MFGKRAEEYVGAAARCADNEYWTVYLLMHCDAPLLHFKFWVSPLPTQGPAALAVCSFPPADQPLPMSYELAQRRLPLTLQSYYLFPKFYDSFHRYLQEMKAAWTLH